VLIERAVPEDSPGYMLALMPMVDPMIDDLDVRGEYFDRSTALDRYRIRSHTGRLVREDPLGDLMARYGDYRGISRGDLLDVLSCAGGPVSYQTTVAAIHQDHQQVTATLASPSGEHDVVADLMVAADGLHSETRASSSTTRATSVSSTPAGAPGLAGLTPTVRPTSQRSSGVPASSSAHIR
jgi:salicylate hydroxylase